LIIGNSRFESLRRKGHSQPGMQFYDSTNPQLRTVTTPRLTQDIVSVGLNFAVAAYATRSIVLSELRVMGYDQTQVKGAMKLLSSSSR